MLTGGQCGKFQVLAELVEAAKTGFVCPGGGRRYGQVVQGVKLPTRSCVSAALAHSCVRVAFACGCVGAALPHSCVSVPLAYGCVSVALAQSCVSANVSVKLLLAASRNRCRKRSVICRCFTDSLCQDFMMAWLLQQKQILLPRSRWAHAVAAPRMANISCH